MLKYQFPAVKGCQAGKDYYICMVPLGLMSKIFVTDSSDVPAEYRAQRKLNEARIPEICGYILSNRDSNPERNPHIPQIDSRHLAL